MDAGTNLQNSANYVRLIVKLECAWKPKKLNVPKSNFFFSIFEWPFVWYIFANVSTEREQQQHIYQTDFDVSPSFCFLLRCWTSECEINEEREIWKTADVDNDDDTTNTRCLGNEEEKDEKTKIICQNASNNLNEQSNNVQHFNIVIIIEGVSNCVMFFCSDEKCVRRSLQRTAWNMCLSSRRHKNFAVQITNCKIIIIAVTNYRRSIGWVHWMVRVRASRMGQTEDWMMAICDDCWLMIRFWNSIQ